MSAPCSSAVAGALPMRTDTLRMICPVRVPWLVHASDKERTPLGKEEIWNIWKRSFRLKAGFFNDRPPFLDLAFLKRAERLRRMLLARKYFLPKIGELPTHCRLS